MEEMNTVKQAAELARVGAATIEFVGLPTVAVDDLPSAVPFLCRHAVGMPVTAWTVRSPAQRQAAALHADQMVFETFMP